MEIHYEYPCNKANYTKGRKRPVRYLVIHYVGGVSSSRNNAIYFSRDKVNPQASAHFFVGRQDGPEIYASVPVTDTAWSVGASKYVHPDCRNDNSISIEMCCHKSAEGTWYFDGVTVNNTIELARQLIKDYNIPRENLLRHYDVSGKYCPMPYVLDGALWENFKERCYKMETFAEEKESAWNWAKENGIFDGSNPDGQMTRNEIAVVLKRLTERVIK